MKIQVVQDLICPWCYIGHHNLETALSEWTDSRNIPVDLEWLPYQLDPLDEGAPQEDFRERFQKRKGVAPEQMATMFDRVTQAGAGVGIEFRFDLVTVAVDTLPGHVAIAAAPVARQAALVSALHSAYFEHGEDIGAPAVILAAAGTAGLDETETATVRTALDDPAARQEQREIVRAVQAAGVTGVPYFVIDSKVGLSGGQPAVVFKDAFEQATGLVAAS